MYKLFMCQSLYNIHKKTANNIGTYIGRCLQNIVPHRKNKKLMSTTVKKTPIIST